MSVIAASLWVAQTPAPEPPAAAAAPTDPWIYSTGGLFLLLVGLGVFSQLQASRLRKQIKFQNFKNQELQKRVKLALSTIGKMERNPDLIHSRDFNLDYLRMRMEEEHFHFFIVNQLKIKVKQRVSEALRPQQASEGTIGIASKPRQIDQIFDVVYASKDAISNGQKRVLFRIQIRLTKLPTQATSVTVDEVVKCIEHFLGPQSEENFWQPTLQGRLATMQWDQKAKPTPLVVLEQSNEGVNVTFRANSRRIGSATPIQTN
ncbi:hypothetical protein IQ241_07315 [Romeria aff. gracilis LEGE 07310]|uniref:Uncharacterized protein n=1 Tax=Vasconcelosia minhoensis LEGE 07310 TaxID=915328 RepID=A0A8J7DB18_9CYAN|nr:hypothetical protein [Romeria gracilis]MBE9077107.1 hypothetical protein [Romeria aff. gracilis LEGE 07310]